MSAGKRQPWGKWYWGDWRKDIELRACSFAARGLWADVLSVMAESEAYGCLLIKGKPPTSAQLGGIIGGGAKEISGLLKELGEAKVYSVVGTDIPEEIAGLIPGWISAGTIVSRRMVRDWAKVEGDRVNGKRGGNPQLKAPGLPIPRTGGLTGGVKAQKLEARSQSSDLISENLTNPPREDKRGRKVSPAVEIIALFDAARVEVWGAEQARAWPSPTDHATAMRWLEAGATPEICRGVFAALQGKFKERGGNPGDRLSSADHAIAAALKERSKPMPEVNGNGHAGGDYSYAEATGRPRLNEYQAKLYIKAMEDWRDEGRPAEKSPKWEDFSKLQPEGALA